MAVTRYGDRNFFSSPVRIDTQTNGTLQVYAYGDGLYKLAGGTLTKLANPVGYYAGLTALSDGATLLYTQNGEFGGASFFVYNADGTTRAAVGSAGAGALPDGPDADTANDDAAVRGPSAAATADGGYFIGYQDTTYSSVGVPTTYPDIVYENGQPRTIVRSTTINRDYDVSHRFYAADGSASQPIAIDNTGAYSNGYTSTDHTAGRQLLADTTRLGTGGVVEVYRDQVFFDGHDGYTGLPYGNTYQYVLTARIVTRAGTSGPIQLNDEPLSNDPFSAAQAADPGAYSGVELVTLSDGFAAIWSETSRFADSSVFGSYRSQGTDTKIRYFDNAGNALTGEITILHRDTAQGNIPLRVSADALSDGRIAVAFEAGAYGVNGSGASDLFVETIGPRGTSLSANLITPGLTTGQGPGFDWALSALNGNAIALTYYDAAYDVANPGPTNANVVETYAVGAQTGAVRFGTNGGDTLTGTADTDLLYGYAGSDSLSGGAGRDFLDGGYGNDTLDGGAGADLMLGGDGADTYYVDNTGDRIRDDGYINDVYGARAVDTVYASADWFAEYWSQVERIVANAVSRGLRLGTDIPDATIVGGAGNDTLDGSTGSFQTLIGGAGNDTYYVGGTYYFVPGSDTVIEAAGQGTDTVYANTAFTLGTDQSIEVLRADAGSTGLALTGNNLAQSIYGGTGNDTLDGGGGSDRLLGGLGDDTYIVDNVRDVVTEQAGEGTDTVLTSVNFALSANVENLTLAGTANLNGTGNDLDNVITGNAGRNVLTGGGGNDTLIAGGSRDSLIGGTGNDTYVVNFAAGEVTVLTELANEGTDTIVSGRDWVLADHFENLTLTGSALRATGNGLDNVLVGNTLANILTGGAGNDTLDGGLGRDSLIGGIGDDTYILRDANVRLTEAANEGTDTVVALRDYVLLANFENLTLAEAAVRGSGNAAANVITGSASANILSGEAGDDTLIGGGGADRLSGGDGADTFVFRALSDSTNAARDVITDFKIAEGDRIDLSALDAVSASTMTNEAFTFIGAAGFSGTAGELRAARAGNYTLVEGDVTGDGQADFGILLAGQIALASESFML